MKNAKKIILTKFLHPVFFFVLTSVLLLQGCKTETENGNGDAAGRPVNIVRTMWPSEPPTLHPVNANSSAMLYIFEYTQKTLTRTDMRTLKQIPVLVKGLPEISEDKLHYTYELRDDVKWDDGSPFTVDDVIFTMKVIKCPLTDNAARRSTYYNLKDIVKDPQNPRRFTMVAHNVHYLNQYLFNEAYMIQKSFWDPKGVLDSISLEAMNEKTFQADKYPALKNWMEEFNKGENGHEVDKLVGLGPYKVTEWQAGSYVTVERKKDWWGDEDTSAYNQNYPDKIVFNFIPDPASVVLKLKNRELDVVTFISTEDFNKLKENEGFNDDYYTGMVDQYSFNCIAINTRPDGIKRKKIFDDVRVRRAVAYLTPVDEINKIMAQGSGTRQPSFVQGFNKDYVNDSLPLIPYDIEKAKELLEAAGWKDTDGDNIRDKMINGKKTPLSFKLSYFSSEYNKELALMLKDAMYKAGVNLEGDPVDMGVLIQNLGNHDFDMTLLALSGGAVPEDPAQLYLSTNWANNGDNFTGFGNAESDELIRRSNLETKPEERAKLLKKLQALVYQEQPFIFLYSTKRKIIISKKYEDPGMYAERPGVILNNLKLKEQKPAEQ